MKQFWERFKNFYIGARRYEGVTKREYERATLNTTVARTRAALIVVLLVQIINITVEYLAPSHLPSSGVYFILGTWVLIVTAVIFSIMLALFKEDKENTYIFRRSLVIAAWVLLMAGSVFFCYSDFIENQSLTIFTVYVFALGIVPVFGGVEFTIIMGMYLAANFALYICSGSAEAVPVRQMLLIALLAGYCSGVQYTSDMRVFNDTRRLAEANRKLETLADSALVEAKEATGDKKDFLERMNHDLRTPLTGIAGLIDLSLNENDAHMPEEMRKTLVKMDDACRYMIDLINYTISLDDAENSRVTLYCETVEGDEFIEAVLKPFKHVMEDKYITFTLEPKERAALLLRLDKVRVQQVFSNIMSNAVKFTPEGGHINALIEYPELKEKIVTIKITISDDGIGMSESFLPTAFDAFAKEQNGIVRNNEGAGLGLSIVKSLVELMGGSVEMASTLGVGTTVTVTLTFERAYKRGDEHRISGVSPGEMLLRGKRILLTEDHPLNLEIAKRLLERRECIVECAQDGKECVDMFSSAPAGYYDAILMDIRMPVMDGLEATREIRALHRPDAGIIPIIAMTANTFEEDAKKSKAAGMNEHLFKPIEPTLLYRTLAEHLSASRMM